jgi:O-antigen/teichoic acid export membrane protein
MTAANADTEFRISKRLVLVNSASSLVARVLNATVLLWVYQYLIRRISAEEFAVYPVVTAVMMAAPLFFLVFSGGISRFIVEAHVKGEPGQVTAIASSIIPCLALASSAFLAVGFLFAWNIEHILNVPEAMVGDARLMMVLLVSGFAFRMVLVPFEAGFHARQRFVELNALTIGQELLRLALLLVLLFGLGPRALWIVVATVTAEATFVVVMSARGAHLLPGLRFRPGLVDWQRARQLMSFGIWTSLGHLSALMQTHSAIVILNLFSTAVDVTSFHIATTLYHQINRTMQLAMSPLQPVMTAMHSTDDDRRLAGTAMRGGRYACWVVLAVAAPLAIYAPAFVDLYVGPSFAAAAWVIVLLMGLQTLARPTALMAMTAIAKAEVRAYYLANFAVMAVAITAMILVAARGGGAVGVALALVAVIALGYALYFWPFFLRLTGVRAGRFLREVVGPGMAPGLAGSAVWFGLGWAIGVDSWGVLLSCMAAGWVAYAAVLFGLCLTPADRADLGALTRRIRAAF